MTDDETETSRSTQPSSTSTPISPSKTELIVAAVDVNGSPERILSPVVALARGLRCRVELVHVFSRSTPAAFVAPVPSGFASMPAGGLLKSEEAEAAARAAESSSRDKLIALAELFPEGVAVETRFEKGEAPEVIVQAAENADVLVLGTSQQALWWRTLTPGVASEAISDLPCTLVLIPDAEP